MQDRLRQEIAQERAETNVQLQEQSRDAYAVDRQVWEAKRRLDTIRTENRR